MVHSMSDDDFDDEFEARPLAQHEAALVRRDIDDLAAFRHAFESDGYKGVSMFCTDCLEEHYYGWDMLEGNLRTLLESGDYPVHEPPYDPKPEDYVNWEYAQGYVDGAVDTMPAQAPPRQDEHCPFCGFDMGPVGAMALYCPACGTLLGIATLADSLIAGELSPDVVTALLRASGLPVPALHDMENIDNAEAAD